MQDIRRQALGGFAVLLLVAGTAAYVADAQSAAAAACLRAGSLVGAVWLAYGELYRLRPWMWGVFLAGLVVVVRWPRLVIPTLFAAMAYGVLRAWGGATRRR